MSKAPAHSLQDTSMPSLSRRTFLSGVAALPFATWFARQASATDTVPLIRYDLACPEGQAMLQVYADAVAKMQARATVDPMSWTWWWYTHFVDKATTKAAEITRLFGDTTTPLGSLANQTWNTCQSHSGQNYNNFLPWHRMALLFLEKVIREVSGVPEFAMPYWNYTSPDPAQRGVLPLQFRSPADPVYACLYRPDRKKPANTGLPIQTGQAGDPMDASVAMAKTAYSNVSKVQGFCRAIDSGVHSSIHVLVGTARNMGTVPFAARDPLFWVHHANIDRLWASWNANGGFNPAGANWAKSLFVFADPTGQPVSTALKDYFDIATLGYSYDALVAPPAGAPAFAKSLLAARSRPGNPAPELLASAQQGTELGTRSTSVRLQSLGRASLAAGRTGDGRRAYLVVRKLHTWVQPDVLYHLYVTPASGRAALGRDTYVGTINFFDAEFHDHGHGMMAEALGDNFYSFDVTRLLEKFARGGLGAGVQVTFVPGGQPNPAAKPLVSVIELVRQ
jgi:hypothetical protein